MAELVVRVAGESGGVATTYTYEFRASNPDGSGPLRQEFVVEPSPDLIRVLCREIDEIIAGEPRSATPESAAKLDRNCRLLFDALFPASDGNLPGLVKGLREAGDPLLIRTNAPLIPWELVRDEDGFLALGHDLGRRPITNRPAVPGRPFTGIRTALVVGDPDADLERVCSWLTGHGVRTTLLIGERATLLRVADELTSTEYDLLHFSGDIEAPAGGSAVGPRLSGGDLLDRRALEPLARSGLPPVVFINGRAPDELAAAFLEQGSKAVIGTRHAVSPEPARAFTERCYADLMAGASAGAAVRAAREAVRESGQLDWANVVLFGDPDLRISDGDTRPAGEPAAPLADYAFDTEAAELMARVVRQAGPFGLATSMDLLIELMSTEDLRDRVRRTGGTGMLDFVDELLGLLRESQAPADGDRVELSGTVTGVLNRAERRARESGRDVITARDLLAAFLAAGAGRAGELLERLGIPAALLAEEGSGRPGGNGARHSGEPLFDAAGKLRAEGLDPVVLVALRVAGLLASTSESVTSTGLLLYGFAVAGGPMLREALRAQGAPGIAALDRLSADRGTARDQLSTRIQRVLAKSAAAGQPATESAVLREILAEPDSSARNLLTKLGIDPDRLLAAINRPGA